MSDLYARQLEQTGSTIFQTLAGVALDIKSKKKAAAEAVNPVNGDSRDIQYLLNAFLILNVFQFGSLFALARLHRKQKREAARRASALLSSIPEDGDADDVPTAEDEPYKKPVEREWNEESTPELGNKPATGTIRSLRGLAVPSTSSNAEQNIPLLRSPSVASSARNSRYLSFASTAGSPPVKVVRTKREIRRGEFFAALSGLSIVFAWVLFMVVAYFRLRSKEERSGLGSQH